MEGGGGGGHQVIHEREEREGVTGGTTGGQRRGSTEGKTRGVGRTRRGTDETETEEGEKRGTRVGGGEGTGLPSGGSTRPGRSPANEWRRCLWCLAKACVEEIQKSQMAAHHGRLRLLILPFGSPPGTRGVQMFGRPIQTPKIPGPTTSKICGTEKV
jgi:hypothetical protein